MWLSLLLDFITGMFGGLWTFYKAHWLGCTLSLVIIILGATVYFQHKSNLKLTATVNSYKTVLAAWEKDDATLRKELVDQNTAILKLKSDGDKLNLQIAAAQQNAEKSASQYAADLAYLKAHPAPTDCQGAMNYILQNVLPKVLPSGGSK